MLYSTLTHPNILRALAAAGHGSQILIADGNYPLATQTPSTAERVYLNLAPGLVSVTDILKTLVSAVPLEAAIVMHPDTGIEPTIFAEFHSLLPHIVLEETERFNFYRLASKGDVTLAIASGEQRLYANILLTIGVVTPSPTESAIPANR